MNEENIVSKNTDRSNCPESNKANYLKFRSYKIVIKSNGKKKIYSSIEAKKEISDWNSDDEQDIIKVDNKKDFLDQLLLIASKPRIDVLVYTLFILLFFGLLYGPLIFDINIELPNFINILILFTLISLVISNAFYLWEIRRREIHISYFFQGKTKEFYDKIISAFEEIKICERKWLLKGQSLIYDTYTSKVNSGADYLIDRELIKIRFANFPWLKTNVKIPSIITSSKKYYFLPDGVVVLTDNSIKQIKYYDLTFNISTTRIFEEMAPTDAFIIRYNWRYVNVDGSPDRRFNDNKKIPECLYGLLEFKVKNKQELIVITSKKDAPSKFYKTIDF